MRSGSRIARKSQRHTSSIRFSSPVRAAHLMVVVDTLGLIQYNGDPATHNKGSTPFEVEPFTFDSDRSHHSHTRQHMRSQCSRAVSKALSLY